MAKSKLLSLAVGLGALAAASTLAFAAGNWSTLPIVGGASFCAGNVTAGVPGTPSVCNQTVPAGPTSLTGNELIPADTNLPSGQQPQSVVIKPAMLNAGPTQFSTPLTGATTTVAAATRQVVINPAGTIAAHTVQLPAAASLVDGQRFGFCSTQVVTTLTVTAGSGTTVNNPPTAATVPVATGAASCVEFVYVLANTTWWRVQ